eukprot:483462_1
MNKIESINCSGITKHGVQKETNIENDFSFINVALSSSLSVFNKSDMKVPKILLFTHLKQKINPTNSNDYISMILDCKNILFDAQDNYFDDLIFEIVNINSMQFDNNFIYDYYSNCLVGLNAVAFANLDVVPFKDVEYKTFVHIVPEDTDPPTVYPTKYPTKYHTKYPTNDPSTDPTIDPTYDPTIDPTFDPTIYPTIDPSNDPTINPTPSPILIIR